jgi:hypothetical protein
MLEQVFSYLGLQFAKFQFRSEFDTPQEFTGFIRRARSVLIILPVGYDEAVIAGDKLNAGCNFLSHMQLTVVHTSTRATSLTVFPRCEVVRLDPQDINRFSLPRRSLLQRIFVHSFDVAIDLNLDFVLHAAYICKASHAKVRVGCRHSMSDLFYNVQVNLQRQGPPQKVYEKFASCIAMF